MVEEEKLSGDFVVPVAGRLKHNRPVLIPLTPQPSSIRSKFDGPQRLLSHSGKKNLVSCDRVYHPCTWRLHLTFHS